MNEKLCCKNYRWYFWQKANGPDTDASISNDCVTKASAKELTSMLNSVPLGDPVRVSPYSWYHNYTKCNVEVDLSSGTQGSVHLFG